jgi:serine/threonine protein kinase
MCAEKGIDGKGLPDIPFWDFSWESTVGTDIFSLGSIFYTIRTGHWPYKSEVGDEEGKWEYEERAGSLMESGIYPSLDGIPGSATIIGCWTKLFSSAADVLKSQDAFNSDSVA